MTVKFDVLLKNLDYEKMHAVRILLQKLQLHPRYYEITEKPAK